MKKKLLITAVLLGTISFANAQSMGDITKAPKAVEEVSGRPEGSVLTAECELDGISFMLLNGGPNDQFKLNGATSFIVECETQEEIDYFWEKLSAVAEAEQPAKKRRPLRFILMLSVPLILLLVGGGVLWRRGVFNRNYHF